MFNTAYFFGQTLMRMLDCPSHAKGPGVGLSPVRLLPK
jgi:hypothetical protein